MPLKFSPPEYIQRAKAEYKKGRKEEAFELLQEALRVYPDQCVDFLDISSAMHSADGDNDLALQEAHQMMKRCPGEGKGYLRAGKLLQGRFKDKKALSLYKLGLKSVPRRNSHYKELCQMHDRLSMKIGPKVDPLRNVPLEVLEMIFLNLSYKERLFCLQVSKTWRDGLSQAQTLWRDIELLSKSKRIKPGTVERLLPRTGLINSLRIGTNFLSRSARSCILSRSHQLRSLEVSASFSDWQTFMSDMRSVRFPNLQRLTLNSPNMNFSDHAVYSLLQHIPSLKWLDLNATMELDRSIPLPSPTFSSRELEAFTIRHIYCPANDYLETWLNLFCLVIPNVKLLRLPSVNGDSLPTRFLCDLCPLQRLEYCELPPGTYPIVPPTVTFLSITDLVVSEDGYESCLQGDMMPNLQCLRVSHADVSLEALRRILHFQSPDDASQETHIKLTEFVLREVTLCFTSPTNDGNPVLQMFQWKTFESVEILILQNGDFFGVDDEAILELTSQASNLQRVDLTNTAITGVAVRALVKNCPKLEYLCLNDCRYVPPDAINLARKHVREVSSKINQW
ncbi:hypothetical protein P152DRAFT_70487 [Eremomyces bilateralis CBS 781.70]|uniref:F-box domain-containing protein n=1 Tax=Eremomyces bilateralis CBS 781.70 TaxID=1392243 RepID=A0A6G1G086_9PEZI|nr:uncharacterized protein P152DRAFT_70487 [Eremomyces bilateralis CBS 781.70]KAF1811341.1 hypothetical protein P152DRAFT_70487 [Eremomyces bilateralis CBS 781.70]